MKAFQTEKFPLKVPNFVVGGTDVIPLDVLPPIGKDGVINHLVGFLFDVSTTPTIS